jgi:membrane fusion protein, multidrug efflux system
VRRLTAGYLVAFLGAGGALACGSGSEVIGETRQAERSAGQPAEQPVIVAPVVSRPLERTLPLPGDLQAFQDVEIHARVQGFLEHITVDRGSTVRRGAVLARVVAPELRAQLSEAEAKVQAAEAQLAEANAALIAERSTFERLSQASATPGVVAGNDVDVARQKVEAARARVEAATKTVEAMRQGARSVRDIEGYLHIAAPFDGVITERSAHVGSLVGPNSGPIVRIQQVNPLRLVAAIPEAYVASVAIGHSIPFTITAFPGETFTGRVTRAAHALDPKTRTMAVELDVNNPAGRLAPGMFAEIRWPVRRMTLSLFVPKSAVTSTTERTFVVRVRDSVAEWVDVKRGAPMDDLLEVFGDLKPGDQVAVRGTDEIRAGTRVRPAQQAAK